jgi:hypothetical protein
VVRIYGDEYRMSLREVGEALWHSKEVSESTSQSNCQSAAIDDDIRGGTGATANTQVADGYSGSLAA